MTARLSLHLLLIVLPGLIAIPEPGRIPKVYNALITSNQNLEPSKAYPVYQPVLHDAFPFPFQPLFYGGSFPFTTGLLSAPALLPKDPTAHPATAAPSTESAPDAKAPSTENVTPAPEETNQDTQAKSQSTPVPPPPATQSPIPLNEFGLPPQVLPLGRFNPAYSGFNHIGPYALPYPNFRFYDPYDPFNLSFGSYPNTPLVYGPLTNVLGQSTPVLAGRESDSTGTASPGAPQTPQTPSQTPPAEPSNLNVLNFSSSDPNIPNVPPPPLPQGGLKPDKTE